MNLKTIYHKLLHEYGPQGWWPLISLNRINPTKNGAVQGYHPADYSFPRNDFERFEICIGAILTQNTAWPNVEQALINLAGHEALIPQSLLGLPEATLRRAIRPSGYYNVKARKLREFSRFYLSLNGAVPTRNELLQVWGIGPETADSMRLYAYKQIEMVVDAYTRRIFTHLGLVSDDRSYEQLKAFCIEHLPSDLIVYQEFHALIVEHAKRYYQRRPYDDKVLQ
ncbi:MAG: endonuclease III domain-containing protein [Lentisphaeria bacterium]